MIRNYEEFCVSQFATKKEWLAGPDWWSAEGTSIWKTTPVDSENHAPVTVGQLKHVAAMARLHLQGTLASVGGEGAAIAAMVDAFTTADPENAAPANVGQLKNVAALFYDRLAQVGYAWQTGTFSTTTATTPYPWTGTLHPENAMPCNIGQPGYQTGGTGIIFRAEVPNTAPAGFTGGTLDLNQPVTITQSGTALTVDDPVQ